jgi:hypothetical protein
MALAQLRTDSLDYRVAGMLAATATGFSDRKIQRIATTPEPVGAFSQASESQWFSTMLREISELCVLPVGWDGYHGIPLDINVAVWSCQLMSSVMTSATSKPSFVPLSGGGLQIEWHRDGNSLEVAIYEPYDGEVMITKASGEQDDFRLEADVGRLREVVKDVAG